MGDVYFHAVIHSLCRKYSQFMVTQEDDALSAVSNIKSVHEGHSSCFCVPPEDRSYPFPIARDSVCNKNDSCEQASSTLKSFESLQSIVTNL